MLQCYSTSYLWNSSRNSIRSLTVLIMNYHRQSPVTVIYNADDVLLTYCIMFLNQKRTVINWKLMCVHCKNGKSSGRYNEYLI